MTAPVDVRRRSPFAALLVLPIRFYQHVISPMLGPRCRYYPSCSSYAVQAIETHGAAKGFLLGSWRVLRCHPWAAGGPDLVPERGQWRTEPTD